MTPNPTFRAAREAAEAITGLKIEPGVTLQERAYIESRNYAVASLISERFRKPIAAMELVAKKCALFDGKCKWEHAEQFRAIAATLRRGSEGGFVNYEEYYRHQQIARHRTGSDCDCAKCERYRRVFADQLEAMRLSGEDEEPIR